MPNERGHTIRESETVCVVDLAGRAANQAENLKRGLPWLEQSPAREGQLAVVGSGPSVRDRLPRLRDWPGEIWATNGSYNFLLDHGIVPHGWWGMDPLPGLADYVTRAQPETTFYIAASCDPSVFDALQGRRIVMWFPIADDMMPPAGVYPVRGGVTAMTRIPFAAYHAGWRDITLFGADSSFDEQRYCYQDGTFAEDSQSPLQVVQIGEDMFVTEGSLMKQVSNFGVMAEQFQGALKFDCDGLVMAYLKSPMHDIDADGTVTGPNADWFYAATDAAAT